MAKATKPDEDTRTQREKFLDTAREHGADGDTDAFRRAVRAVAAVPKGKPKKTARKRG